VTKIPNVLADPVPQIAIQEFTNAGPVLAVRPFSASEHYQQVFFDTNSAIVDVLTEAGYPIPATYQVTRDA
jgi:small conductance mechanosensitive channel